MSTSNNLKRTVVIDAILHRHNKQKYSELVKRTQTHKDIAFLLQHITKLEKSNEVLRGGLTALLKVTDTWCKIGDSDHFKAEEHARKSLTQAEGILK